MRAKRGDWWFARPGGGPVPPIGRAAAKDVKEDVPRSLEVVLKSVGVLKRGAALREGVTAKDVNTRRWSGRAVQQRCAATRGC